MDDINKVFIAVIGSILGLATLSVILSKQSNTPGLIQAVGSTLSKVITAAVTPVPAGRSSGNVPVSTIPDFVSGGADDIMNSILKNDPTSLFHTGF